MPLWTVATPTDTGVPLASLDLDGLLVGDCVWHCRECDDVGQHDIVKATTNNAEANHHETCNLGLCSSHECKPDFTAIDRESNAFPVNGLLELEAALERSTYAQLAEFVKANPDRVRLNRERGALQFLGCNEAIVASYTSYTTLAIDELLLQ
jgi:hypothetical protein